MAKRYELSDEAWGVVSDLFIETHGRGATAPERPPDAMACSGCSVRVLLGEIGQIDLARGQRYQRFRGWRNQGTFDQMLKRLHLRLNEQGLIDLQTKRNGVPLVSQSMWILVVRPPRLRPRA